MIDRVNVIIPTIGYSLNLNKLVVSLLKQKLSSVIKIVLIVNKCSKDDFELLKEKINNFCNSIHFIYCEQVGVNFARNIGISHSEDADMILFLDDDCEVLNEHLIEQHILLHKREENLFAIGGLYITHQHARFIDQLYNYIQMRWLYQGVIDDQLRTQYLIGGHFSIKNKLRKTHNLFFNEEIVYGGSELGFFLKAYELKLKMKLCEVNVQHNTNESVYSVAKKIFKQGKGKALTDLQFPVSPEISVPHLNKSFKEKIYLTFYNYIFWFGYYSKKEDLNSFFRFIFLNIKGNYLLVKFKIKEKIYSNELNKKKRGDRF